MSIHDPGGDRRDGARTELRRGVGSEAGTALRLFAALADNVRDYAIFLMDSDGVITYWGEGARLIKWWTKEQAEGSHLRLLYPPGGSEDGTADAHLRAAVERGEYTGEGQRMRSDGSSFWAGVTLTALWDDAGVLMGFAKVTRDLTARRAADALLQTMAEAADEARRSAVASNLAKSGFLATMSHEIRTPINAVIGYIDLLDLEIEGALTPGQRRHLARAAASARHLLTLINEVLDFSRIEADHSPVARSAFAVGDVVSGALALLTPQAGASGLEVADAVSGYAAGLAVWGDEDRVRQILVNLIGNAVKFTMPRGHEPGRVIVSVGAATTASPEAHLTGEGPWVYVRVEDTGTGIPVDRLAEIFEPFVQVDMTLTRAHGGTGLGLAISRRLARLMGGDITVRSEFGVGSTFFLWLPAAPIESLATGGLQGHGPGRERSSPEVTGHAAGRPMRAIAETLLDELEAVLHAFTLRVREDPEIPSARDIDPALIEDRLATLLGDLASTFRSMDIRDRAPVGEPTAALLDGSEVQRVVAERHGIMRAKLGWSEREVRREFQILAEELTEALRRGAAEHMPGPSPEARVNEMERALELVTPFIANAERMSLASYSFVSSRAREPKARESQHD